jgi:4-hydroxybenzoate polyprenyltransferase
VGAITALVVTMRPRQWTKNLIVFAPLIFSGRVGDPRSLLASFAAFLVFCVASGAVYAVNDVRDLKQDRLHAKKRERPIAAGELNPRIAVAAAVIMVAVALAGAFGISVAFGLIVGGFLVIQLAYTFGLKHAVILDVMAIAAGFIIRAAAGAVAVGVAASPWLYMCAALLALFLGLGKRRHELLLLDEQAVNHRAVLDDYSSQLLDMLLSTVMAATIIAYSLYTFFSATAAGSNYMMLTIPFVMYGVFRYGFLMYKRNLGGNPEEILLTDVPLIITILAWLLTAGAVIYLK